jgi:hypothetical protein
MWFIELDVTGNARRDATLYIQENLVQLSAKQSAQIMGIMNITEQIGI